MVEQQVAAPRRIRRTQQEVRGLLLQTARDRFAEHGYKGASTRLIAADAGASESLIFNYFRTKSGLFEAAVLEPFGAFIDDYVRQFHQGPRTDTLLDETRQYVGGMYDLLRRHRKLVLALAAADAFEGDALEGKVNATFARLLEPIENIVAGEVDRRGWQGFDATVVVRAMLGMIISMTVLDNLLFAEGTIRPPDDHVVDQLTRLLVDGYRGLH